MDSYCNPVISGSVVMDPPYGYECYNTWWDEKQCNVALGPGAELEPTITLIRGMLNRSLEFKTYTDYAAQFDGFQAGEHDFMLMSWQIHNEMFVNYTSTPIALYYGIGLLAKQETAYSTTNLITVFTWDLWLCIVGTLLAIFIFDFGYLKLIRPYSERPIHYESRILYCLIAGVILNLICNVYSNMMAIALFSKNEITILPFKDVSDLSQKVLANKCTLVVLLDYFEDEDFWVFVDPPDSNTHSWAQAMRDAYKSNPPIKAESREAMAEQVLATTKDHCYVGVDYADASLWYNSRYCDIPMNTYPDDFKMKSYVYYYSKRISCLDEEIAKIMHTDAWENIVTYSRNKYYVKENPPSCGGGGSNEDPLTVTQLVDAFYLLLGGVAMGIVVLVYEFIYNQIAVRRLQRIYARLQWRKLVANRKIPLTEVM